MNAALETLLDAYIECTNGKIQDAWHLDDETPAMGPVVIALTKMCNPIPKAVLAFIDQRDVDHDNWTIEAFSSLELSPSRLSAPDLLPVRIRLAIQAMSLGYSTKFFALLGLEHELDSINLTPSLAPSYAKLIVEQSNNECEIWHRSGNSSAQHIINTITASLELNNPGEAALAAALTKNI